MLRGFDAKRLLRSAALTLAVLGVAALAITIIVPRLHSEDRLTAAVLTHVEAATGTKATLASAHLAIWPRPVIVLQDLAAGTVRAKRTEARLSIRALLAGRIEPVRLKLIGGALKLDGDTVRLRSALEGFALPRLDLQNMSIVRGTRALDIVEGRVDHVGGYLSGAGDGRWSDSPVAWSWRVGPLAEIATGADARIAIESDELNFDFEGRASASAVQSGTLNVRGPSLAGASSWAGSSMTGLPTLPFSLATRLDDTAWGWELSEARVTLGKMAGEGIIGLTREADGKPSKANGTLALGAVAIDMGALREAARGTASEALHLDLRFSAPEIELANIRLSNVAATLRTDGEGLAIGIGDATMDAGRATGLLTFDRAGAGELRTRLSGVPSTSLPLSLPVGAPRPSGTVDLTANVTLAPGAAPEALFEGATAEGRVRLEDGTIENLDLRAIASLGPNLTGVDVTSGPTVFDRIDARFALTDGLLELSDVRVEGAGMAVDLAGRIDLERGVPGLRGEASGVALTAAGDGADEVSLAPRTTTFFIGGTLARPLVVPVAPDG